MTTELKADDWTEEIRVCAPFNTCHNEVVQLTKIKIATRCWDDVSMSDCKAIVESCGGIDAVVDRFVVISKSSKSAINCLESNSDVQRISLNREEKPTMASGRKAINIENLQLNRWKFDFAEFGNNNVSNDKTPIIPILLSLLYNPNNLFSMNPPYFYSLSYIFLNFNS